MIRSASGRRRTSGGSWIFPVILLITVGTAIALATGTGPLQLWMFVFVLGGWTITLCLHEFAHAAISLAGGDTSVRERGYLTLNLLRYTDPTNSFIIPLLVLVIGGIPLPGGAVLVEPGRLRYRWWSSLVSAGGPAVNLLSGVVLALVAAPMTSPLGAAVAFLALLQFFAGILNLLPIPGFDGFGVITPYLPAAFLRSIAPFRQWAPLAVFVILFSVPTARNWLWDASWNLYQGAGGDVRLAIAGLDLFPNLQNLNW
ncbi:site-2 protease family protein [Nakamurella lactea]|uniref:site-2 protease family protein n=1 Tax=Nakamurella lactea TaxID=459515 RepID=UPI00040FDE52|nr:site-2 protease family protein [Nakamurella lactea]